MTTLEQTSGGEWLDNLKLFEDTVPDVGGDQAANVWSKISANYAEQAEGSVTAIVNNPRSTSIFLTQELPMLLKNNKVTEVVVESIAGNKIVIPKGTGIDNAIKMIEEL